MIERLEKGRPPRRGRYIQCSETQPGGPSFEKKDVTYFRAGDARLDGWRRARAVRGERQWRPCGTSLEEVPRLVDISINLSLGHVDVVIGGRPFQ